MQSERLPCARCMSIMTSMSVVRYVRTNALKKFGDAELFNCVLAFLSFTLARIMTPQESSAQLYWKTNHVAILTCCSKQADSSQGVRNENVTQSVLLSTKNYLQSTISNVNKAYCAEPFPITDDCQSLHVLIRWSTLQIPKQRPPRQSNVRFQSPAVCILHSNTIQTRCHSTLKY